LRQENLRGSRKQEEEAPQLEKNEKRQPQMPSFNPT
jgi:hypothetical protein